MISVERVMREIEDDLRRERRARLLEKGAPQEYRDADVYAAVEEVLRRAIETRDHDAVLLPELLSDDHDWTLETSLRFTSHRPVVGPVIVFFKRRVLLPLTRWLYQYSLENFQRQQRINRLLFACIEELAIENATLRKMAGLSDGRITEGKDERIEGGKRDS
jgi:hypothetical protein